MMQENRVSETDPKVRVASKWFRSFLVVASIGFSIWFFYAVYEERNGGTTTDRIAKSAENSKRLRTEVRSWLRQTFPESAARMDERFGFFEFARDGLPITQNHWVLLAHGLDEPGNLWADLAPALAEEGFRVLEFRYPNDQPIHESAQFFSAELNALLDSVVSPAGLNFVGHSMGGLVFRDYLTHPKLYAQVVWKETVPVKTLIQLGTPNHGSWLATYRLPVELRDHLFKDYGKDALLGMFWDGAGEAQIDLKPQSTFLTELNKRPFPESIYWAGVAGTGSPVDLLNLQNRSSLQQTLIGESVEKLQITFPELFKGSGDGVVSIESLRCKDMNIIYHVEAGHRDMVRKPGDEIPPAVPIVIELLNAR